MCASKCKRVLLRTRQGHCLTITMLSVAPATVYVNYTHRHTQTPESGELMRSMETLLDCQSTLSSLTTSVSLFAPAVEACPNASDVKGCPPPHPMDGCFTSGRVSRTPRGDAKATEYVVMIYGQEQRKTHTSWDHFLFFYWLQVKPGLRSCSSNQRGGRSISGEVVGGGGVSASVKPVQRLDPRCYCLHQRIVPGLAQTRRSRGTA